MTYFPHCHTRFNLSTQIANCTDPAIVLRDGCLQPWVTPVYSSSTFLAGIENYTVSVSKSGRVVSALSPALPRTELGV